MTGLNGIEGLGQAPGCAAAVQKVPCHGLPRVAPRRSHSVVDADEGSSPWESLRGYTRRAGPREPLAQALNVPPVLTRSRPADTEQPRRSKRQRIWGAARHRRVSAQDAALSIRF